MGVDMRSLFIALLLISTTVFADSVKISPVELKYYNNDFFNLEKNEPTASKLVGTWNCVGSAGYAKVSQCSIDQIRFGKTNSTYGLTLVKGAKVFSPTDVMFEQWILGLNSFADGKVYNHIVGKTAPDSKPQIILVGGMLNSSWKNFTLSDCTSFGDQMLICKTLGNSDDYKCSLPANNPERCSSVYEQNMKTYDQWSVFVKQGAKDVPQLMIKSFNDIKKEKKKTS